ncbi:MAG TPA: indole-3-glycerol phosphate synthase TrpC [Elusimicrobia bacterium]|nr:MAG: hypothetical protein A2278_02105 [Elusimicrobia bacterium RIFOXYA12_FULL_49_49]OGS09334.1 MAG: hypothetical protein A2386_06645 [Elusimicrobia bacterium RIFOXYB1_FULL_48_9]OGS16840.1 MAG: hypothetical protein A2251_05555 [Elusimicrobia bacterium RIFOXYA2_FULL_47_53]OGS32068.1 MAG: hypothetical protein A2323_08330 [Elusimicrobia bacterium RIFOXYB2_FULL_46_23]HBU69961.1 indole-3-glycerol phosphate synthase TrpC [Elusimicrobiota bacterium]
MHSILKEIVASKTAAVEEKKKLLPADRLKELCAVKKNVKRAGLYDALKSSGPNIIAEIKRASPSKGLLTESFDPLAIAKTYESGGAAAISVLTEETFFLGSLEYLTAVKTGVSIPVLRKDFITEVYQLYESYYAGADAVLLIAALLKADALRELFRVASALDMDCLFEIHDEEELKTVIDCGARIVGINNRNLNDFKVDLSVSERLIPKVPKDKLIVIESGISGKGDINRFAALGAGNFLIGETLMRSADPKSTLRELRT